MNAQMSVPPDRPAGALHGLRESDLDPNPFVQFECWYRAAEQAQQPLPEAMALATTTRDGLPSLRMVLLKGVDERGFVFFTNYEGRKGSELTANPQAALLFYWQVLSRQVRVEGSASRVSREESEAYFRTRPREARLGAWASLQSEIIPHRDVLDQRLEELAARYPGDDIPLPPTWGGFRIAPDSIEFWQSRSNRLHDRLRYTRQPDASWLIQRLSP